MTARRLVSKRRDAPYRPGTRTVWVKVKTQSWREANALGCSYRAGVWVPAAPPAATGPRSLMTAEAGAMHGMLVQRADAPEGCTEGSDEQTELGKIVDAIETYEARRLAARLGARRERGGPLSRYPAA